VETIILNIETMLKNHLKTRASLRFLASGLILNCQEIRRFIQEKVPEKVWLKLSHYLKRVHSINNAFYVANRMSELQEEILKNVEIKKDEKEKQKQVNTQLISKIPGGNYIFLISIVIFWYYAVIKLGGEVLVKFFYNGIIGRYLEPAISSLVKGFHSTLLESFIIGKYGLFTIWFSYSFAIILPILIVFFLVFSFLNESGLFTRLAIFFNRFLRKIGMSGYSMSIITLSSSCKVISFLKTKLINDQHERRMIIMISILAIPCISQLGILSLTLGLLPWPMILLFLIILFLQLGVVAQLFKNRKYVPDFIVPINPIVFPRWRATLLKSWNYVYWYIREATPLLLIGNLILFGLFYSGWLAGIRAFLEPLFVSGLNLPGSVTDSFLFGLFRKDLGAIFLYDLVNTGELNSIQLFVSLLFITTAIPCIGVILVLIKRRGLLFGLKVTMYSLVYSYSLAYIVNLVLRI